MSKSSVERRADDLFSRLVRERDGDRCRRCGSERQLTCAHVWSRRYHSIRWVAANAVCLCWPCHSHMEGHRSEWRDWCIEHGIAWDALHWRAIRWPPETAEEALARMKAA